MHLYWYIFVFLSTRKSCHQISINQFFSNYKFKQEHSNYYTLPYGFYLVKSMGADVSGFCQRMIFYPLIVLWSSVSNEQVPFLFVSCTHRQISGASVCVNWIIFVVSSWIYYHLSLIWAFQRSSHLASLTNNHWFTGGSASLIDERDNLQIRQVFNKHPPFI